MTPPPKAPSKPTAKREQKCPRIMRLMRDGLVWCTGLPWPSPAGMSPLQFTITDIFYDEETEEYVIFGAPNPGTPFAEKGAYLMGHVPFELGSAIHEAVIPREAVIAEINEYIRDSEDAWASRWSDDDDDEGDGGGITLPKLVEAPGGST